MTQQCSFIGILIRSVGYSISLLWTILNSVDPYDVQIQVTVHHHAGYRAQQQITPQVKKQAVLSAFSSITVGMLVRSVVLVGPPFSGSTL